MTDPNAPNAPNARRVTTSSVLLPVVALAAAYVASLKVADRPAPANGTLLCERPSRVACHR